MPSPSSVIVPFMRPLASALTPPTFEHVLTLMGGTLLASVRRSVASALRAAGLIDEGHFTTYHRVLNRAVWSPAQLSRIPLGLVLDAFVAADEPVVIAVDDSLERRFGQKVAHKGIYHDAVRSTPGHPATTTGIRWLCCTAIARLPWTSRPWALPFLTIPAPPPAVSEKLGKSHRTLPERAASLVRLIRRWLPDRAIVLVGDSSFGVVELALACRVAKATWIARMRMRVHDSIWASRPSASGRDEPSSGPRPACSGSSRSWRSWTSASTAASPRRVAASGMPRRRQPSSISWQP